MAPLLPKTTIESLPEELLLTIVDYLESDPPSQKRFWFEPSLGLTDDPENVTMKNLSRISKRWRRLVVPSLFKFLRLRLDPTSLQEANYDSAEMAWPQYIHTAYRSMFEFLETNGITNRIEKVTLLIGVTDACSLPRSLHEGAAGEWRYAACAEFWHQMFCEIDPCGVVIVAPPLELACLLNCSIDISDGWAFSDMNFHLLELAREGVEKSNGCNGDARDVVPSKFPDVAGSSLLHLRPWTHVGLNEGSFLAAYATYEYFERGPPSSVHSIMNCLMPSHAGEQQGEVANKSGGGLSSMKSFSYAGIFPFESHFRSLAPVLLHVESITLQLGPTPQQHGILNSKQRVGKAELEDCWSEILNSYLYLISGLGTVPRGPISDNAATSNYNGYAGQAEDSEWQWRTRDPRTKVRKLVIRDFVIAGVKGDLNDIFANLCLPIWAEYEEGVFTRLTANVVY